MLSKHKENEGIELALVYFNSTTKTVINSDKYMLENLFKKLFCRIDNWINKGSGWIIESIDAEYVRISVFSQLSGCTCNELTCGLRT